ncbi:NAD(P)H-dependent oxidoreductase [Curtobacterium sp. PhB115]|uniref:NAD(P)H-dependent oxidoreductase n=1 Tax=Curtobacterium sp. PhB115 TaxID=2485173 RepID=UPI000FBADB09|nr:NAD(P)H-dependent oxidoreductase [Curtobacterium sp. PhB115]ROP65472.1 Kef-type potassium/proton antiporter accessory protein (CPA2 family) [Curtobacterium sp. PhB115]
MRANTRSVEATRLLLVVAHPALPLSHLDQHLVAAVADVPRATVRDLYATYEHDAFDPDAERRAVTRADEVVLLLAVHGRRAPRLARAWSDAVLDGSRYPEHAFGVVAHGGVEEPAVEPDAVQRLAFDPEVHRLRHLAHRAEMRWRGALVLRGSATPAIGPADVVQHVLAFLTGARETTSTTQREDRR